MRFLLTICLILLDVCSTHVLNDVRLEVASSNRRNFEARQDDEENIPGAHICVSETILPYFAEDRDDCRKYYLCLNATAFHLECPAPLVYDPTIRLCIFNPNKVNVNCNASRKSNLDSVSTPDEKLPEDTKLDGNEFQFKRSPDNCAVFQQVHKGIVYGYSCPPSLAFDEVFQACRDEKVVKCAPFEKGRPPQDVQLHTFAIQTIRRQLLSEIQQSRELLNKITSDTRNMKNGSQANSNSILELKDLLENRIQTSWSLIEKVNNIYSSIN